MRAAGSLGWAFLAVPALSPTILCSTMLAGASAASSTIGSVVEDVEMAVGASSGAALALEVTIASACCDGVKKLSAVCRVCVRYVCCVMVLKCPIDYSHITHEGSTPRERVL